MSEQLELDFEGEIQAKGLTAPRVTPQRIEDTIAKEVYFTAADGMVGAAIEAERLGQPYPSCNTEHTSLTFCVLSLRNGFTVTGESACVSPENFDAEIGRKIARQNAVQKIWQLEGYMLADRLALQRYEG